MFNAAHLHILINHFPIIGTVITLFVLAIGILKKSDDVKKVSVLILILTALVTIPVYLTGEKAQAKIEGNYEDVDEDYIDRHEDFALYSFIAMDIAGAVAILAMLLYKKPKTLPQPFAYIFAVMLIVVLTMMGITANLGGSIHHPEVREDALPWEPGVKKENVNSGKKDSKKSGDDNKKDDDDEN